MSLAEEPVAWAVIESSPDGIAICDSGGHMAVVNHQIEVMFGYERSELLGRTVEIFVPPETKAGHVRQRAAYAADPHTRPMGTGLRLEGVRRDGSRFPLEIALSPVSTDAGRFIVASVRDVSARIAIENELQETRMKAMLSEDRERIARDLHDTVIQRLFADGLTIQALLPKVSDEVQRRLQNVLDDHDDAIREIRTTILGLGRSRAGDSGLRRAILDVVDQTSRILGFRPTIRLDGVLESRLDAQTEGELLATLREALSNAARHAQATSIEVEVSAGISTLTLSVRDNGRGIPPDPPTGGHGLVNMRTRAHELGGQCVVDVRPSGGTAVEWIVPLP
jgi:PAS domain S-box-containing protein